MKKALTIYIPDDAELAGTVGDLYLKREGEESFLHYRIGGDVLAKDQEFYAPFEGAMKVVHGGDMRMAIEEELKKAHQMFDNRNLITELKWSRRNFNQIRGAISKNSKLYYTWIFDQCIKALEQESITDWIPVNNRLPEEKINPITEDFYEYQCTVKFGDFYDVRSYKFGHGHWWNDGGLMDGRVIAWMPSPEPYKDVDEVKKT